MDAEGDRSDPAHEDAGGNVPIVGIGASAGGLSALEGFFSGLPDDRDPGMAFVVVQHLAPDHESLLSDLIDRQTRLEVFQVEDGMQVVRDCVYVIPPNRDLSLAEGRLHLTEPEAPRGRRLPIDFFFRSLARDQRALAMCVILSGTASDGTLGLRMIKGEGGMAMVQSPETAEHSGMPRSAIDTGLVDFVLPPAEMLEQLMEYARTALEGVSRTDASETSPSEFPPGSTDARAMLFAELRNRTGHDFSEYKDSTVHRRLQRRMAVLQVDRLEDYVRFLQSSPEEVDALFRDLLIGVTRFFRDPEAFDALSEALSELIARKEPGSLVRVWVPGCSTGEEAYSVAILLRQQMEAMDRSFRVQVFATDIDPRAIQVARAGVYPASIAPDLPDRGLTRFFVPTEDDEAAYRIREDIREMLVFSEQNVLRDPPFSRLDLITCRNLLIYLDQELQKQLIPLFHYALNPDGLLLLGTAESVGDFTDLFAPLSRRMSLYRRRKESPDRARTPPGPFARPRKGGLPRGRHRAEERPRAGQIPLRRLTEGALLEETAAVAALVNEEGKILYLHGRTGRYLEPAPGDAEMNVLRMAREGLRRELSMALHRAVRGQERVQHDGLRVGTNGDPVMVDLVVRPVPGWPPEKGASEEEHGSPLFLVVLKEVALPEPGTADPVPSGREGERDPELERRILELEEELEAGEGYLRATQEEMQSTNEELRTSIEELQSTNEELQSTNEELETSQEELQSLNEEMATVNAELENKVSDLSRSQNDMNNLLAGTGIATIFVDMELRIQRFTPTATRLVNLIKADEGRSVGDLASKLASYDSHSLSADIRQVLDTLEPRELEVEGEDGRWYLLGLRPYRTLENVIEGAVITFIEITELKKAKATIRETEGLRRLAVVVRDSSDPIVSLDLDGRIRTWNPAATRIYGWSEEEALQMNYLDLVPDRLKAQVRAMLEAARVGLDLEPLQTERLDREGSTLMVWLTATELLDESGRPYGISATERPLQREPPEGT